MASNKHQKLHSLSQLKRSQPLIRTLQILVFICVFSLIILWGPSWVTTNIKSWRLILSTSISNMLSLYINRNLMFLVCNTIIVFVTRGFGYIGFARPAAEDIYGEYMGRSEARHQPEAVAPERNGSVEGEGRMVIITESLENVEEEEEEEEEDNHHLHHQPRHYLHRHDHGHQHQHHHGHHHSRLHQNQQQQKKHRRREEQQKQLKRRQEQQQQRQKQLHQQQLLLLRQQEQQQEQQQQVLLLLRRQEQRRQRRQQQEQRWQQQQLLLLQQQQEEDGPSVMEASDETFDAFIKTMKERMRMENRQLLLTY